MLSDDPAESFSHTARGLAWFDFLGVDIVRYPTHGDITIDNVCRGLLILDGHHVKSAVMVAPGHSASDADIDALVSRAADVARTFGNRLTYYELGNEPDLTFFWERSIEEYARIHERLYRAIEATDPRGVVSNGSLCFAGADGDRRSRRFILVVDPATIDAWAYHGHGPVAGAERAAYTRVRDEVAKWHKGDKPFIETESGVAAHSVAQLRVQARTVVEKMVYAQSVKLPTFYWFRLLMTGGDEDYTNLVDTQQPRPVVLAYRTMVKTLRHQSFSRELDHAPGGVHAYAFAGAKGAAHKTLVLWNESAGGEATVRVAIGASAANVRRVDLFGNDAAAPAGVFVSLAVGQDPQYVTFDSAADTDAVAFAPPPLTVDPILVVTFGEPATLHVHVRNDDIADMSATLVTSAGPRAGVTPDGRQSVHVSRNASQTVDVNLPVAAATEGVTWPTRWTVFTNIKPDALTPELLSRVPPQLPEAAVHSVYARDGKIDLKARSGAPVKERAEGVCYAEIHSPHDRTIHAGAAADWWMEWSVNGRPVYNTLEFGNQGSTTSPDRLFDLPLRAGRNVVAVRVLSGSQGFGVVSAGPDELAAAAGKQRPSPDAIEVSLKSGGTTLATASTRVVRRLIVPATKTESPTDVLGESNATNFFLKEPDSTKRYRGEADFSARIWLWADASQLHADVEVTDDTHRQGDAARLILRDAAGVELSPKPISTTERDDQMKRITYHSKFNRADLPGRELTTDLLISDDDFGGPKQTLLWSTTTPTSQGLPVVLPP